MISSLIEMSLLTREVFDNLHHTRVVVAATTGRLHRFIQFVGDCGLRHRRTEGFPCVSGDASLLSLTYVMMKNEVLSALRQYNLDPFLGILHADRHGRPSLALDLQEEFRPIFCDAFVTRLVNRGTLTHDDFRKNNRLTDDAFKTYLSKFDDYMKEEFTHPYFEYCVSRRKSMRQQAILLRKAITGELDDYHALAFKR